MKNNATLIYNFILVIGDFVCLVGAFSLAYILRVSVNHTPITHPIHASTYLGIFLVLLPFWILIFALIGLYDSDIYQKRFSEAARLLVGSFIGMMFLVFWDFMSNTSIFPAKVVPIYGLIFSFIFLLIFRNLARFVRTVLFIYKIGLTNILLVGNTPISEELIQSMHNRRSGYRIVGLVGGHNVVHEHLRRFDNFLDALKTIGPDSVHVIMQTELFADDAKNGEILSYAQENHIGYRFIPGNSELFVGNIDVELFRSSVPVIAVRQTALFGWGRIVKRLFDFAVASLLVIILSPIFLIIAVIVKFSDRGPVFFRQKRLTRFNQEFSVFKFRTINTIYNGMTPDEAFAKMERPDLLEKFRDNGNYLPDDPRNTKIGRFLRSTSLDELPQLFNVIKGDLSLVGPRALIPSDLASYKKRHNILSVKSGITGLAQVSGRNNIPIEERRKLDLYYAQNWSFWLDLIILAKTFRVLITHEYDNKKYQNG